MVAVETRKETSPPESEPSARRSGGGPPSDRAGGDRRAGFHAFVAVLAAVALVAGFYVLGRAMKNSPPSKVSVTGAAAAQSSSGAATAGHDHTQAVDDRGFSLLENGQEHGHGFTQGMDRATRALLAHQMTLARQVAMRYPTIKDAEAAGLRRAGPFSPGLGTHYINFASAAGALNGDGVMDDNDIEHPIAWIYDGTGPDAPIAGLFYMSASPNQPEGFAGPNDTWHIHRSICITRAADGAIDAPLGADHDATKAQCDAVGGSLVQQTQWLLHVWAVPGYESPTGVFAHLSPALTCNDGTYHIVDVTTIGTRKSACVDGTE